MNEPPRGGSRPPPEQSGEAVARFTARQEPIMEHHSGDGFETAGAAVAVAASAGGVEALTGFVRQLPPDFPAAVLVVLHISDTGPSVLPDILSRASKLPVAHPHEREPLVPGAIVVAPPGQHLRVEDSSAVLDRGPRENGHRPSADALFRSVAAAFGSRAAGVVLSGTMDDGAAGLRAIALAGGLTIVQDPGEAAFPGMPRAAIAEARPDVVCPVAAMSSELSSWVASLGPQVPGERDRVAVNIAGGEDQMTELSQFTCPDCGGTLWLDHSYGAERYRCRVGHSFSDNGLLLGKHDAVESALWAAIVALEERAEISRRVIRRLERSGRRSQLERYHQDLEHCAARVNVIKGLISELVQESSAVEAVADGESVRDNGGAHAEGHRRHAKAGDADTGERP